MNGEDLFRGLNYVNAKYIDEAETVTQLRGEKKIFSLRRPVLIAAIVAMMLMLVGCAVVYVLKMQDLKIGEATETRDYRLVDGVYVKEPHEVSENVLTLAGLKGSAAFQACADFYVFKENCNLDMYAEDNSYSKALDEKAVELAQSYGLKKEGNLLQFRTTRNLCDALGVERFYRESEEIHADITDGECWESGNFCLDIDFTFPEDLGYEVLSTYGALRWNQKDSFSRNYVTLVNSGDWIERTYTTSSGSDVLNLQSPSQERGYILCDRGEALMSLQLDVNIELLSEENGVVSAEYQHMTEQQINLVADIIDFAIQPNIPTQVDVDNQPEISQSATQNGWTVEVSSVETDGYVLILNLEITAPEGTVLPIEGNIIFANYDILTPQSGAIIGDGRTMETQDNGDGLDNTANLRIVCNSIMADRSAPYADGVQWNLHIVDLVHSWWDTVNTRAVEDTITEGEWLFPITFDESVGDYSERELIQEPITVGVSVGWSPDGSDVVEDVTVTSFKLRKFSATIEHNGEEGTDFSFLNGEFLKVVMNDGSKIQLSGGDKYLYETDTPIDLDNVDHILFADGTKLDVSHLEIDSAIEFVTEPVEVKFVGGYAEDAYENREYLYETFELTSVLLYPTGATIEGYAGMDNRDYTILVFMKDGSSVTLYGNSGGPNAKGLPKSKLVADMPIDLEQVSYLMFQDGTKLKDPTT